MIRPRQRNRRGNVFTRGGVALALWANAALLGVIAIGVFGRNDLPSFLPVAAAQNQPPIAGGAGVFVMPAQVSTGVWGCYLLDVDSQTLAVYIYSPGTKQLKLEAARTYRYDRGLQNFNTGTPSPNEVRELLERERRLQQNNAPPTPAPGGGGGAEPPQTPSHNPEP